MNELKPRIHDEGNDLDYILVGDYYIPAIELSESDARPIGKWGQMRWAYLQENNTLRYNHLIAFLRNFSITDSCKKIRRGLHFYDRGGIRRCRHR